MKRLIILILLVCFTASNAYSLSYTCQKQSKLMPPIKSANWGSNNKKGALLDRSFRKGEPLTFDKMVFVHMTQFLPAKDENGNYVIETHGKTMEASDTLRDTLHFTINTPVKGGFADSGPWQDMPICIVIPADLMVAENGLPINLFSIDTFWMGTDISIPKGSAVLVSAEFYKKNQLPLDEIANKGINVKIADKPSDRSNQEITSMGYTAISIDAWKSLTEGFDDAVNMLASNLGLDSMRHAEFQNKYGSIERAGVELRDRIKFFNSDMNNYKNEPNMLGDIIGRTNVSINTMCRDYSNYRPFIKKIIPEILISFFIMRFNFRLDVSPTIGLFESLDVLLNFLIQNDKLASINEDGLNNVIDHIARLDDKLTSFDKNSDYSLSLDADYVQVLIKYFDRLPDYWKEKITQKFSNVKKTDTFIKIVSIYGSDAIKRVLMFDGQLRIASLAAQVMQDLQPLP